MDLKKLADEGEWHVEMALAEKERAHEAMRRAEQRELAALAELDEARAEKDRQAKVIAAWRELWAAHATPFDRDRAEAALTAVRALGEKP